MKTMNRRMVRAENTNNGRASGLTGLRAAVALGLVTALAPLASAANYTWTNTAAGASGYWTNGVNWGSASYPGQTTADNAYLTNATAAGNAYTNLLDSTLANPISTLVISNATGGQAWLVVANASITNGTLVLGNGGRFQIDNGGVVTNGTLTWGGTDGAIYLNSGGRLVSRSLGVSGGVTATVTRTGTSLPSGIWDFRGNTLIVNGNGSLLRVDGGGVSAGVVLTNFAGSGPILSGVGSTFLLTNGAQAWQTSVDVQFKGTNNTWKIVGGGVPGVTTLLDLGPSGLNLQMGFDAGSRGNTLLVDGNGVYGGAIVTNGGTTRLGAAAGATSNGISIVNGGRMFAGSGTFGVGYTGGSTGSFLNVGSAGMTSYFKGFPVLGFQGSSFGNTMTTTNAVIEGGLTIGNGSVGVGANSNTVTVWKDTAWNFLNNNVQFTVSGSSTGNVLVINGGMLSNVAGVFFGYTSGATSNASVGSSATIRNGGQLLVNAAGTVQVGKTTNSSGNVLWVEGGGLLEANTLITGGPAGQGNVITNSGGVYQFTTNTPVVTANSDAGSIAINGGTVSFRGVTNADVGGSLGNNQLKNMLFSGNNTFRLNAASNWSANQNYTFGYTSANPSNYGGLEMISGNTAWKSAWLAISNNGTMLVSNTSASIQGVLTNSGTIRVVNASAAFASNVVLSGGSFTSQGGTNTFEAGGLFLNGGLLALDSASQVFGTVSNRGGAISLLNTANADIKGNWKNSLATGLTNMVWLGTNAFRLDNSSTTNTGQDYVFDSGLGVTNYARLEMVNGTTLWQGGSLTIGANGTMLASNTTATIQGYATNSGNIRVVNALAIWASNVVLNGGIFVAQNATNQFNGGLSVASGQTLTFTNGSSRMTGVVSNNAGSTIQAINSIVTWQDAVVIGGRYFSDPSTNIFTTNLTVTASGALQGSNGDLFVFYRDFLNQSTVNTNFSLWQAAVLFTNGAGTSSHTYDVTGSGSANWGTGFTNFDRVSTNFAIGTLSIAPGNRLMITGQVGGGITNAVYVGWLDIQGWSTNGGFSSVTNTLFSALNLPDINLYYSREDPRNQWLNEFIPDTGYNLWGGGLLLPIPEPSPFLAFGAGLTLLAFLRRRRG